MGAERWPGFRPLPLRRAGFNEAAPRWARRVDCRSRYAPRNPSFNEAAPRWARRETQGSVATPTKLLASMRPRHDGRGEGAHHERPHRLLRPASMRPRHDGRGEPFPFPPNSPRARASMRPRHDGRGEPSRKNWSGTVLVTCFNEAAPRWARRVRSGRSAGTTTPSFNEAAPRWARRADFYAFKSRLFRLLQ